MVASDWERVRKLFDEAAELPPPARKRFLELACGDNPEVRAKVEELLLAMDNAGGFMKRPRLTVGLTDTEPERLDLTGARVGSYRVTKRLGRGGMGEVFLAERADGAFYKQVAIKLLPPEAGKDEHLLKRFLRERQILASLEHHNVARLLDGGTYEGRPYVVMEYVEGQSLRELLKDRKALPINLAVRIARQVCDGLQAAHRNGVIHRDIKPENIMVTEGGNGLTVKVLDFGIARSVQSVGFDTLTKPGMIFGTPSYMSPEQAAGHDPEKLDQRSDVYSFGLVVYEMVTGQAAFTGESVTEILHKQLTEMPVPPAKLRPDLTIPHVFDSAVMRALEKDPAGRQPTASELAESLGRALADHVGKSSTQIRWYRSLKIAIPLALFVTALLASLLLWAQRGERPPAAQKVMIEETAMRLEYNIFRMRDGETTVLAATNKVNSVRSGDRVYFEFVMPFDGQFYLFYELGDGLVWVNPTAIGSGQTAQRGKTLRVPEEDAFPILKDPGLQKFLAVYAPEGIPWSIADELREGKINIISSADELPHTKLSAEASEKLRRELTQSAKLLTFPDAQSTAAYRLESPVVNRGTVIYHQVAVYLAAKR